MARLPVPGNDSGTWGTILNDFLSVEHNTNGTLKTTGTLATKAADNAVVHSTGNETVAGTKTFSSAPVVPSGAFPQSAVTNLTSDLAGKEATANKGTANGYASLDGTGKVPLSQLPTLGTGNLNYRGAWAASTAYATNDLVTFSGGSYVALSSFTSGAAFDHAQWSSLATPAGTYNVQAYGAKGDGVTDDTTAIKNVINLAVAAGIANGTHHAEIYFPPAVYLIGGSPVVGGATAGRAQIPLPVIPHANQKFLLTLKGTADATGLYHWQQTTPQRAGAVLRSTHNGGDIVPTGEEVSVVGGPTSSFGYGGGGSWNNMLVTVEGILVEVPTNPNVSGFDFQGMAQANVWNAGVLARKSDSLTGAPPIPDPKWAFGLKMPQTNNNDNCNIGYFSCEGLVYGLVLTEHVVVTSIRAINCYIGIVNWGTSGFPHHNIITYASIENCVRCIVLVGRSKLTIECANIEISSDAIIYDPSNGATGYIGIGANGDTAAILNNALSNGTSAVVGASNIRIISIEQTIGHVTAPTIPASTVAFRNPFWRDAMVNLIGGTVTDITVDGATVLNATPATVYVPSGKSVTMTYSSAPTWQWTLL